MAYGGSSMTSRLRVAAILLGGFVLAGFPACGGDDAAPAPTVAPAKATTAAATATAVATVAPTAVLVNGIPVVSRIAPTDGNKLTLPAAPRAIVGKPTIGALVPLLAPNAIGFAMTADGVVTAPLDGTFVSNSTQLGSPAGPTARPISRGWGPTQC